MFEYLFIAALATLILYQWLKFLGIIKKSKTKEHIRPEIELFQASEFQIKEIRKNINQLGFMLIFHSEFKSFLESLRDELDLSCKPTDIRTKSVSIYFAKYSDYQFIILLYPLIHPSLLTNIGAYGNAVTYLINKSDNSYVCLYALDESHSYFGCDSNGRNLNLSLPSCDLWEISSSKYHFKEFDLNLINWNEVTRIEMFSENISNFNNSNFNINKPKDFDEEAYWKAKLKNKLAT